MTDAETLAPDDPAAAEISAVAEACLKLDPRAERDTRHLAMLREMEETSMAMQALLLDAARRDARRQAQAEMEQEPNPPKSRLESISRAQSGTARELRHLMKLEIEIDDARIDRQMGIVREVSAKREAARKRSTLSDLGQELVWDAREAMEDIIEAEAGDDADRANDLLTDMYERLDALSHTERCTTLCVGQMITEVVADLGVTPDWSEWADEEWAQELANIEGSPYGPTPRVIQDADGRYRFSGAERVPRETGPP